MDKELYQPRTDPVNFQCRSGKGSTRNLSSFTYSCPHETEGNHVLYASAYLSWGSGSTSRVIGLVRNPKSRKEFGLFRIVSLLFADNVVLLVSSELVCTATEERIASFWLGAYVWSR